MVGVISATLTRPVLRRVTDLRSAACPPVLITCSYPITWLLVFSEVIHIRGSLTPSGSADANTGRGGLYVTYFNQGWWVDVAGWAGGTNYSTSRQGILGMANGSTIGWEASTFGEAGKDFLCGNFTFGPVVAMQYTNVHVNGFGENGSLVPLDIHGDRRLARYRRRGASLLHLAGG